MKGSDLADLAQQETVRAENPHRSRQLNGIVSLTLVLTILIKLWLKDSWLNGTLDLAATVLAAVLGLEMLWRHRRLIQLRVVIIILHIKVGTDSRNTNWPIR